MALPTRFWRDLAWTDFASLPPDTVAVLPLAAIEQHGPHLPVSVDAAINEALVARMLARLPPDFPALVLPTQEIGCSVEHLRYPGTLTATPETLIALWTGIGHSVARAGVRRLVLLNSHGGQVSIMDIVARRLRIEAGLFCTAAHWPRLGYPPGLVAEHEARFGIHAGQVETAMMLAIRPDLVRMDRARDFRSAWAAAGPQLAPGGGAAPAWQAQDLTSAGAVGDAAAATPALGEALLDHAAAGLAALLHEVRGFDIQAWLGQEPRGDAHAT